MAVLSIWRRRWLLSSFMLVLALLGIVAGAAKLPRVYQTQAVMVLLPSHKVAAQIGSGNPYLSFNDSLSTAAAVLSNAVEGPEEVASLKSRGIGQPYTVTSESTLSQSSASGSTLPGPFIAVAVTGASKARVESTLTAVVGEVSTMLQTMQAGIPAYGRISILSLSVNQTPSLSISETARSIVAIAIPLILFALGIPVAVDALKARSRRRRAAARDTSASTPAARDEAMVGRTPALRWLRSSTSTAVRGIAESRPLAD
jgi:hypothetical protein